MVGTMFVFNLPASRYKLTYIIKVGPFCFTDTIHIARLSVNVSLQTGSLKLPFLVQVQYSQWLCHGECVEY
jgi:hypothetical protein